MTKLILSTGNIVSGGPSIIRKPGAYRSNLELTNSLRSNFLAAQQESVAGLDDDDAANGVNGVNGSRSPADTGAANGHATATTTGASSPSLLANGHANGGSVYKSNGYGAYGGHGRRPPLAAWTHRDGATLYIPRIDWPVNGAAGDGGVEAETGSTGSGSSSGGLQEEPSQYDTTVKLFFLPGAPVAERAQCAEEALALVFRELVVDSVDLLVVSFPGMSFEGDCEWEADKINASQGNDDEEVATWAATAESFYKRGLARRLGVAEFGSEKLGRFLERVHIPPAVDQINIRNCCNVPPPLATLAKTRGIELLVHTDCTDILPPGTLRELLGQGLQGAGVLADGANGHAVASKTEPAEEPANGMPADALQGDLTPQWVVKYTAVVRDRGVIENKGYFAGALLHDD